MKKYAATLLSVFLVCGCSNITPNNEKVEVSQEKLENMTALTLTIKYFKINCYC